MSSDADVNPVLEWLGRAYEAASPQRKL